MCNAQPAQKKPAVGPCPDMGTPDDFDKSMCNLSGQTRIRVPILDLFPECLPRSQRLITSYHCCIDGRRGQNLRGETSVILLSGGGLRGCARPDRPHEESDARETRWSAGFPSERDLCVTIARQFAGTIVRVAKTNL